MISASSFSHRAAASAYSKTSSALTGGDGIAAASDDSALTGSVSGGGFGDMLQSAIESTVQSGQDAEQKAATGLSGHGNLTDIVTSVSQAQITLQTASAIRDRVIQSYQDVMRMTI